MFKHSTKSAPKEDSTAHHPRSDVSPSAFVPTVFGPTQTLKVVLQVLKTLSTTLLHQSFQHSAGSVKMQTLPSHLFVNKA